MIEELAVVTVLNHGLEPVPTLPWPTAMLGPTITSARLMAAAAGPRVGPALPAPAAYAGHQGG